MERIKDLLDIDGDYLEGGGQILRTASSLSVITKRPIRVFNIRQKRPKPGLKNQHLKILEALQELSGADVRGLELGSREITFIPKKDIIDKRTLDIDIGTAGSIGLVLQSLLLVAGIKINENLSLHIKGGTCGLGAIPVDYYPNVVFPILSRSGLEANMEILKRGYYPKGGGKVSLNIRAIKNPKPVELLKPGKLVKITGLSIASLKLASRQVAERQGKKAEELLKRDFSSLLEIKFEYADTYSLGSEINLYAYTQKNCILSADARGELKKKAEDVAKEAYIKLKNEILSGAACDLHLADNLIAWMSLLGGRIRTSQISRHTQTNIWVCEQFFGKIFRIDGNIIEVKNKGGLRC